MMDTDIAWQRLRERAQRRQLGMGIPEWWCASDIACMRLELTNDHPLIIVTDVASEVQKLSKNKMSFIQALGTLGNSDFPGNAKIKAAASRTIAVLLAGMSINDPRPFADMITKRQYDVMLVEFEKSQREFG